jgi:hypothetical protein
MAAVQEGLINRDKPGEPRRLAYNANVLHPVDNHIVDETAAGVLCGKVNARRAAADKGIWGTCNVAGYGQRPIDIPGQRPEGQTCRFAIFQDRAIFAADTVKRDI